jgi:pyridoxamine 5'-phosphate oxidase
MNLAELRRNYIRGGLKEADLHPDPIKQFQGWLNQALAAELTEPNAVALATCDARGRPSVRMVLLKGLDSRGFAFYTNLESRKARELTANPNAALCFYWAELERQVRVTGQVSLVSREDAAEYFQTRPRGSQLGAWASKQSSPIADRSALDRELVKAEERFTGGTVPLPPFWGGYRLEPHSIEFWQGRANRMHDRILYTRDAEGVWTFCRLSP